MPAMNDDVAKTCSLTAATSMPTELAARSLDRTANIRRPEALRRILATPNAKIRATTTRRTPKIGRDASLPRINPRSQLPSFGLGTLAPPVEASPTYFGFLNTNSVMATPPARVMIARLVPRTRNAGNPTMTPNTLAINAARIGAIGKGIPHCVAMRDSAKPATPANAI